MNEKDLKSQCRICGDNNWSILYKGPIRMGKFGNWSKSVHIIWKCNKCQVGFFDRVSLDYGPSNYRTMVDGDSFPEHFYTLHDGEQIDKLKILGIENLRGKVLADIGCGAGSFLDLVKGYASETIAVEPARSFHQELKNKGHLVYEYCQDALKNWEGRVDIAVSFAVLEHVENPLEFLKEVKSLLKPNGFLLLSTPNSQDWLLQFLPEVYGQFFYRYAHTWYFNQESIQILSARAGFKRVDVRHVQRFDISNALFWIRDHCPTGIGKTRIFQDLDNEYKKILEKQGQSDYLYMWLSV